MNLLGLSELALTFAQGPRCCRCTFLLQLIDYFDFRRIVHSSAGLPCALATVPLRWYFLIFALLKGVRVYQQRQVLRGLSLRQDAVQHILELLVGLSRWGIPEL